MRKIIIFVFYFFLPEKSGLILQNIIKKRNDINHGVILDIYIEEEDNEGDG